MTNLIVVLGGTSDIGTAVAKQLRRPEETILLAGRNTTKLQESAEKLGAGGPVRIAPFDAADTDSHREFFATLQTAETTVTTVIVAFGVLGDTEEMTADPEKAVELSHVNYTGAISATLHAANLMKEREDGRIIILSSVAGQRVRRENFLYGAGKAGIDAFTEGLRSWYPGLRILTVRPGFVHTQMTRHLEPSPFATTSEQVARRVEKALAKSGDVVWAPGVLRWVMLLIRLLPRALWQRIQPGSSRKAS